MLENPHWLTQRWVGLKLTNAAQGFANIKFAFAEGESFKTKRWRHINVCKSKLDVNANWHQQNLSKFGDVDTENGIFQTPKR